MNVHGLLLLSKLVEDRQHFLLDYILETSSSKLGVEPLREKLQHNVVPGDLHIHQTQLSQFFLDEQLACWQYRSKRKPKVGGMAPMCRSFGGLSRLNRVTNSSTWHTQL